MALIANQGTDILARKIRIWISPRFIKQHSSAKHFNTARPTDAQKQLDWALEVSSDSNSALLLDASRIGWMQAKCGADVESVIKPVAFG